MAVLIYLICLMYQSGVASNTLYKRRNLPFTLGVAGDSGSGKSTFIALINSLFGTKNLLYIEGDGDHKWERGDAMWVHFTHLNPKANYLYKQASNIEALRLGQSVTRVDYNHKTGEFTNEYKLKPRPYILLCGLHALYLPQIRKSLDLKIYMDIEENLRRYWKVKRDIDYRGYSKELILNQIEERIPDAQQYVYPQKKYADLIITYFDPNLTDCFDREYKEKLNLKLTMSSSINLETLVRRIEDAGILVEYDYDEDLERQTVIFSGEQLQEKTISFKLLAYELIPHLDEIVHQEIDAEDNFHGLLKLIILLLISFTMQEGNE